MALSKLLCFFVYFAGQMSDGMANSFFKFKQFTIHQERSAMRVSTDGVLLGAWSRVEKSNRILDIGTGTGLIAIMAAQRSLARIDAVELDFGAARLRGSCAGHEAQQQAKGKDPAEKSFHSMSSVTIRLRTVPRSVGTSARMA